MRIYPHALREQNAYYSPDKKALLFGYFPVERKDKFNSPGTVVFTCLSHDIIAHETTHALLDGVHPRFNRSVNPDVLAFHEAFADIVALFQHFSYPGVLRDQILREELSSWYDRHYGRSEESNDDDDVVSGNAKFRRIEHDWLHSADRMAMAMGEFTNNSSLVLAFELGKGGKVLLFAGDAQRGNWASWAAKDFPDSEGDVNVRELLGRTVLYKVGHHGSHNATLQGRTQDDYPNLAWLGRNRHAEEFAAMVPAVRKWAIETAGWDHPLPSISQALKVKCGERVIQTDTDLAHNAEGTHAMIDFMSRTRSTPLYFDYVVMPD